MPKITIVTVCYNAEKFIESTIKSVLNQNYPNLEYIILDGGSTDSTLSLIEKYRDRISHLSSRGDKGQYFAIQEGFDMSTGEIMCWLNADDIMMPWTLSIVAELFSTYNDIEWITGLPSFINRKGQMTGIYSSLSCYPDHYIANGWFNRELGGFLQQESMFWRRNLWERSGGLNLELSLAADYALWVEFAKHASLVPVSVPLAAFRQLPGEQRSSVQSVRYDEEVALVMANAKAPPALWRWIAKRGLIARSIARLLIRYNAPAIIYDTASGGWRKIYSIRSISRVRLDDLINLYLMRHFKYNKK